MGALIPLAVASILHSSIVGAVIAGSDGHRPSMRRRFAWLNDLVAAAASATAFVVAFVGESSRGQKTVLGVCIAFAALLLLVIYFRNRTDAKKHTYPNVWPWSGIPQGPGSGLRGRAAATITPGVGLEALAIVVVAMTAAS